MEGFGKHAYGAFNEPRRSTFRLQHRETISRRDNLATEDERVHQRRRCEQIQNRDNKQPARKVLERLLGGLR